MVGTLRFAHPTTHTATCNRHCERSEAIHSSVAKKKTGLLRRFRLRSLSYGGQVAPRNDGKIRLRIPAALIARGVHEAFAPKNRGRGECRVPAAPIAPRANGEVKHTSIVTEGSPDSPGIPARNGFNGLYRALPGERIRLVTVISGLRFCQTRS